jgi:hypothetical protein
MQKRHSTLDYAVEKITRAVHTLATQDGTLKHRFMQAHGDIAIAPPNDLPDGDRQELQAIQTELLRLDDLDSSQLSMIADRLVVLMKHVLRGR